MGVEPYQTEYFSTREEWLQARRSGFGIGSSDVPAILGLSRFQSPLSLYYEKLGIDRPSAAYEEAAAWGHILEEPIALRYAMDTKRTVVNPQQSPVGFSIARSTVHRFMVASVDRLVQPFAGEVPPGATPTPAPGMGVLELKNAHFMMKNQWLVENNNEPPVEYQVQLQHQLAVTGAAWGSIAALIGGCLFVWADRLRDDDLIAAITEKEIEFVTRLEKRQPPPADGSDASREVLKKLYPKDTGEAVTLPPEAIDWHAALEAAKKQEKAAKTIIDDLQNKLRQAIGDATVGILPGGGSYSHKLQGRGEFVSPAVEFRVLRFHKPGRG